LSAALKALPRWSEVRHGNRAIIEQLQSQQDMEDRYFVDSVAVRIMATSRHYCRSSTSRCLSSRPFTSYTVSQQQQASQQQQQQVSQ
jgi:hypothetical protein